MSIQEDVYLNNKIGLEAVVDTLEKEEQVRGLLSRSLDPRPKSDN